MIKKNRILIDKLDMAINKKYEFDYFVTTNKNDIINDKYSTIIYVDNEDDIDRAINSISYVYNIGGLITIGIWELFQKFNNSGVWNYKYIKKNTLETAKKELSKIKSENLFMSIWCNGGSILQNAYSLIDIIKDNNSEDSNILFRLPVVYPKKNTEEYEIVVLYK